MQRIVGSRDRQRAATDGDREIGENPLRGTETVSGIVDDIQEQAATQLRGQVQIVWTDAPDPWIVIAVFLALGAVVLLWRVRL